jgi:hypothetical protein
VVLGATEDPTPEGSSHDPAKRRRGAGTAVLPNA